MPAVGPNRHRCEIEDPGTASAFNADPAEHHVSNHTGGVLGDQRQLRNELLRRPNALDERRDLVGVSHECRTDHLCDHGMVRVALGTDDDALGHGCRWYRSSIDVVPLSGIRGALGRADPYTDRPWCD